MVASRRFALRYGLFRPLLSILGAGPRWSYVDVDAERVRVRMGWSFRADIPRRSVAGVAPYSGLVTGIGVHGWRGRWLVNGAASGLVTVSVDPPARAWVLGLPVRLRRLCVSLEEPGQVLAALEG